MFPASMKIAGFDPELAAALDHERIRQEDHIELIASENYASPRVSKQGSVLRSTPRLSGKRYYGGCESDVAEQLRSTAPGSSSAPTSPTCSRTRVRRPMPPRSSR
jgi:glycine hydroxymethyltransferase